MNDMTQWWDKDTVTGHIWDGYHDIPVALYTCLLCGALVRGGIFRDVHSSWHGEPPMKGAEPTFTFHHATTPDQSRGIKAVVATYADLPNPPLPFGIAYLTADTRKVWTWGGTEWACQGVIQP